MHMADILIYVGSGTKEYKTVEILAKPLALGKKKHPNLQQACYAYAMRLDPGNDVELANRKCVMQAEWVNLCLKEKRHVKGGDKDAWEIQYVHPTYLKMYTHLIASTIAK